MKNILIVLLISLFSMMAQAKKVADVELPDSLAIHGQTLTLNGTGVRTKVFFDIYAAGLYLLQPSQDGQSIIEQNEPMALRLHIVSGLLSSDKMKTATREGFEKSTNGHIAPIQSTINTLIDAFKEDIVKNDVFEFIYEPTTGVQVYKNGKLKTTLEGLAFKQAFFGIWLSNKPTQKSLKKGLLNK